MLLLYVILLGVFLYIHKVCYCIMFHAITFGKILYYHYRCCCYCCCYYYYHHYHNYVERCTYDSLWLTGACPISVFEPRQTDVIRTTFIHSKFVSPKVPNLSKLLCRPRYKDYLCRIIPRLIFIFLSSWLRQVLFSSNIEKVTEER